MIGLTRAQHRVLEFIRSYCLEHGYSPSFQDIADGLGLKSKGNIHQIVAALVRRGAITHQPKNARSIAPVADDPIWPLLAPPDGPSCSKCGGPRDNPERRYCQSCQNAYMRDWRKAHPLNEEQKQRDTARSYANVYKQRGKLVPEPCVACGDPNSEMHHLDHELPLDVTWMCRGCHMAWHAYWRDVTRETFSKWLISRKNREERAA